MRRRANREGRAGGLRRGAAPGAAPERAAPERGACEERTSGKHRTKGVAVGAVMPHYTRKPTPRDAGTRAGLAWPLRGGRPRSTRTPLLVRYPDTS